MTSAVSCGADSLSPGGFPSPVNQLTDRRSSDLLRLTPLRAVAALVVFTYHLGHDGAVQNVNALSLGDTSVAFFFVLSGFVLAWSTSPRMSTGEFYRRRFARVYPSHLVALIAAIALPVVVGARTAGGAIGSLFLVQAWWVNNDVSYGFNAVAWSLSCEMAFYAAFPFLMRLLRRLSSRARWTFAFSYAGIQAASGVVAVAAHSRRWEDILFHLPAVRFAEFVVGAVAALEVQRGWRMRPAVAGVLVLGSICAVAGLPTTRPLDGSYLLPTFFAITVVVAQRDLAKAKGWLTTKPLIYAGQLSFCFYLVHELVIVNLLHSLGRHPSVAILDLVVSTAAAVALHELIEKPAQKLIRRIPLPASASRDSNRLTRRAVQINRRSPAEVHPAQ